MAGVLSFQEEKMVKYLTMMVIIVSLAVESQASTVAQKKYAYVYDAVRGTGSGQEYVICVEPPRSPLVPELKPPSISLRFGDQASSLPPLSTPVARVEETASRSCPCEYRLEKTILFPFDRAKVEDGSGLSLLANILKQDPSVTGIRIRGFTCDMGAKAWNDRLAMRRAVSVAAILGKVGLKVDQVSGEGKCCYVPGERRLSRRVEISVMRSAKEERKDET
jgi:outer membrane protein OmpA-like peptidoglycan-associated protein